MEQKFTIRVYGLLIEEGEILIADEVYGDFPMTKFPGGGLEQGEGTIDCLRREFMEELNVSLTAIEHFYTTDFFVASAFHPETQVISIYYKVKTNDKIPAPIRFTSPQGQHAFRWTSVRGLSASDLTFPIDRYVLELLQKEMQ